MSESESSNFPDHWQERTLGEILKVVRGVSFPSEDKKQSPEEDHIACLRTANVQETVDWDDLWYISEEHVSRDEQYVRENDILISTANSYELVGKVSLVRDLLKRATLGAFISLIRVPDELDSKFFFYQLRSTEVRNEMRQRASTTTNISNISTSDLNEVPLGVPPLPEQRRIVAKIEELFSNLDAGMNDLQTTGQQLERYRMSVLQAAVEGRLTADWRRTHDPEPADRLLERILEKRREQWEEDYRAKYEAKGKEPPSGWKSRYTKPEPLESAVGLPDLPPDWQWVSGEQMLYYVTSGSRGWSKYYDDEGQLFIRVGDISDPDIEIDFSDVQRVNLPDEERGHRSLLEPRDLLISITADIGKVGIVPGDIEEAYINQHVALTRPSDPDTTKYLAYYLISPGGGAKQFQELQKGATKAGLTLTNIKEIAIALPPASELKQIVDEVERLLSVADDAAATADREHTRAERLRQSILKQAFSGRLVPHDEDASPTSIDGAASERSGPDASKNVESDTENLLGSTDPDKQIEMDL